MTTSETSPSGPTQQHKGKPPVERESESVPSAVKEAMLHGLISGRRRPVVEFHAPAAAPHEDQKMQPAGQLTPPPETPPISPDAETFPAKPSRAERPLPDVLPTHEKLRAWEFQFRSFVDGDISTSFPVDLMIDARHFFPREHALGLERRYGIRLPERLELPHLETARLNADRVGLTKEEHNELIDIVKKHLVATRVMAARDETGDTARASQSEHLNRLERMLHLASELGEVGPVGDPRKPIEDALARVEVDEGLINRLFRRPKAHPRLSMDDVVRFTLKAINADIAAWDALEVVLNASLGDDETIAVPVTVAMSVRGEGGENHLIDIEVPLRAAGTTVAATDLAEAAFTIAQGNRKGNAAVIYGLLAELHLFYDEMRQGYYANLYAEEQRRMRRMENLRRDLRDLFDVERAGNDPQAKLYRTARRSMGSLSGVERASLVAPASAGAAKTQWVDPYRELKRAAYGIVASNLFSEAADTMIDGDPRAALTSYELARFSLQVAHARLKVAFTNPPEKGEVSTRDLIAPLNFVADRMMLNIKENVSRLGNMMGSVMPARPGPIVR